MACPLERLQQYRRGDSDAARSSPEATHPPRSATLAEDAEDVALEEVSPPPPEGAEYKAYRGVSRTPLLAVRNRLMTRLILNAGPREVIYDELRGSYLVLRYVDTLAVEVRGRNLATLAKPLGLGRIEWLQEYGPRWPTPRDRSAPFIQKIAYHDLEAVDALLENLRASETEVA